MTDPRERASWVNEIPGYRTEPSAAMTIVRGLQAWPYFRMSNELKTLIRCKTDYFRKASRDLRGLLAETLRVARSTAWLASPTVVVALGATRLTTLAAVRTVFLAVDRAAVFVLAAELVLTVFF